VRKVIDAHIGIILHCSEGSKDVGYCDGHSMVCYALVLVDEVGAATVGAPDEDDEDEDEDEEDEDEDEDDDDDDDDEVAAAAASLASSAS
jgi:hypothetical protein